MKKPPRFSMWLMGESSLPPFKAFKSSKLYRSPKTSLKNIVRRFFPSRHLPSRDLPQHPQTDPTAATEPRPARSDSVPAESPEARDAIHRYLEEQGASVDRALRFKRRAERLENEGIPSDTARNRAERARQEVSSGLSALRASFVADRGNAPGAGRVFDQEVERAYPDFNPPDTPPARPS